MTIEQKPEFNRFLDSYVPLTWAWRRQQFKSILPVVIFFTFYFCEIALLNAWLADRLTPDWLATVAASLVFLYAFIWGIFEVQIRVQNRSKRILKIEDKWIVLRPAKRRAYRWKEISKLQFEPVAAMPGLTKVGVYGRFKKIERRQFSMILEQAAQVREIIRCLESKKTETQLNFEIKVLEKPEPKIPRPKLILTAHTVCLIGACFLLHGMPLLLVALETCHDHSESHRKIGPHAKVTIKHFVQQHFSNTQELHDFILKLSIGLIIVGASFYLLGMKLGPRKTDKTPTPP